ncbi:L-ascorbate metabolism protein UlaG (beta-lactamase superfamily) [Paenibacillus taihuensis]|uniref:L-ascorbate metabolism protein UlaG (Beta-lactamase superfamily) n=1 Tax=Paenibacillus taihuensis TaxID=1156355 RepID=A0A3D9Q3S7_9BACL|nr:MBL fold metallo-hydrolase [Paenibacillus taihuensis]REE56426.1 L-ascorbate metabolism protein UlaG (beta-lactamase superfamily) [Paenibacillus taihuensis]
MGSRKEKGKYVNSIPTNMGMSVKSITGMLRDTVRGNPKRNPAQPIPFKRASFQAQPTADRPQVTWFGHSAFLLELEGRRLLFDPMFAQSPSPVSFFGGKRYSGSLPLEPEEFPALDAIILSHDHYDHLHKGSILKLKGKTKRFIVPLGVGSRLRGWGIDPAQITEHDWWQELQLFQLKLACTPARHFSGRGLFDRNSTLWCSWVIAGERHKVFFSGDSGYGPHFKQIGDKYGPFDLTLMECGQYDERWAAIHMMPEQTVQAHMDVQGRLLIPVHWGAFTLAFHDWFDPIERAVKAAKERGVVIAAPHIGETTVAGSSSYNVEPWWRG